MLIKPRKVIHHKITTSPAQYQLWLHSSYLYLVAKQSQFLLFRDSDGKMVTLYTTTRHQIVYILFINLPRLTLSPSPVDKKVERLCSPLKSGLNRANLFLNRFTWWYHLCISLNIVISADNFINIISLLDLNPANFSANPYYNTIAGSWSKTLLVIGTNAVPFQSTSKFLVNIFSMPCNFRSLHQLIPSIWSQKGRCGRTYGNNIISITIILDSDTHIKVIFNQNLLDTIHYNSSLKKEVTGALGQSFWCQ